jgi:acetylglutamate kinase
VAVDGATSGGGASGGGTSGAATVVVKLGGEVVGGAKMAELARDLRAIVDAGSRVVVTHGGGPQATALSKKLGLEPRMVGGRRVTDAATLDVMKMVIAGQVNVDLCTQLRAAGLRPVGLHDIVRAHKRPPRVVSGGGPEPIDFGHVGDVDDFDLQLLARVLDGGWLPVVACLGHGSDGAVYNINADIVANQLAGALQADALVLVTGAPGVLRDINDAASRIPRLTIEEGKRAIADGVVSGGMIPKLEESFAALSLGARAIYIVAGDLARAVREPGSVGTVLVP